ncbi:Fungalysin/Thermolysin Extracellular metalloproteinase 5 [Tulasnella sp. 330]|nr:Fungalysin/Thermolysin Extracellular metalloproteinase 5 [Tulasnella sp. 330]KAG8878406.1 Fungalysin/Thermolysin Extracellular metalloproteinase 5 [Tulasnella sp. 331]KAG8884113.1 Fungalysin/Thermolysin Extracellular metalloproteinase 5 [Tulasnella sp. 332]
MHQWALALSALAATTIAHVPERKSLSFGPKHEHAKFNTAPEAVKGSSFTKRDGSHSIAKEYVRNVLGHPEDTYVVREDSYKDSITGIEHVYLRQMLYGVEVADGDINLNILDGKVISYGDSFYRGPPPSSDLHLSSIAADTQDHGHYCAQLRSSLSAHFNSDAQLPLSAPVRSPATEKLTTLYEQNCVSLHALDPEHFTTTQGADAISGPKDAILYFLAAAHPSPKVSESILANFVSLKEKITSHFVHHLHGNSLPTEILHNVPHTESPVKVQMSYVQTPCGEDECADGASSRLNLVWRLEVEMQDNWYEAYVDAQTPSRIMSVVDWVSDSSAHAQSKCWPGTKDDELTAPVPKKPKTDKNGVREVIYKVWPWGVNDPTEGPRDIVKTPYDVVASPIGWHTIPVENNPQNEGGFSTESVASDDVCHFTTTWGNNVQAQENWEGRNGWHSNKRPQGNDNGTYVFQWGASQKKHDGDTVDPKSYIDLAVTQLFYTTNMVHDLYYRYGFNEEAGNFQNHNFGKGGKENDAVIAQAQDGSGYNNANFATPPDGQRGKMRMYVWDTASPYRDGDLEAGIVIHELSHGLSTRLTGGPANSGCLGWGESGGMGEGWGDFLATTIRSTKNYSDFAMGAWAANRPTGIRNYIYSLDETVNPSMYKTLDGPGYWGVHAIGEVWAEILWVVEQRLIAVHGFSETLFPPVDPSVENDFYRANSTIPKHGNTLMVQLVLTGMKIQPCRPSFFDARKAIIQADEVLTGGENLCEIWKGFASRGLGPFAKIRGGTPWGGGVRTNDHSLPEVCGGKKPSEDDLD